MAILSWLSKYWAPISFIGLALVLYGHMVERIARAQDDIEVIERKIETPHPLAWREIGNVKELVLDQGKDLDKIANTLERMYLNQAAMCAQLRVDCK